MKVSRARLAHNNLIDVAFSRQFVLLFCSLYHTCFFFSCRVMILIRTTVSQSYFPMACLLRPPKNSPQRCFRLLTPPYCLFIFASYSLFFFSSSLFGSCFFACNIDFRYGTCLSLCIESNEVFLYTF